jgi:hypothetical protein
VLEEYRVLNGMIPAALDGVWYFSSKDIHCDRCLKMEKKQRNGEIETAYYHDVAAAVVRPADHVVLPLIPEFIRNGDGGKKQERGRNAGKRWYREEPGAVLTASDNFIGGDDLYACHSICAAAREAGMKFFRVGKGSATVQKASVISHECSCFIFPLLLLLSEVPSFLFRHRP